MGCTPFDLSILIVNALRRDSLAVMGFCTVVRGGRRPIMIEETMVSGEPFDIEFEVIENDLPKNITGFSVSIELRKNSRGGDVIAQWNDESPQVTRSDATGKVNLAITAPMTRAYDFNIAFLDLLALKDSAGIRSEIMKITLDKGATR